MMHGTERANHGPFFDDDMAAQSCSIGQDDVIADYAVMSNVGVGHDQGMAPNARQPSALGSAAIDGHELADNVVVTNLQTGGFGFVTQVLRRHPDGRERKKSVASSDSGWALNCHMRD